MLTTRVEGLDENFTMLAVLNIPRGGDSILSQISVENNPFVTVQGLELDIFLS